MSGCSRPSAVGHVLASLSESGGTACRPAAAVGGAACSGASAWSACGIADGSGTTSAPGAAASSPASAASSSSDTTARLTRRDMTCSAPSSLSASSAGIEDDTAASLTTNEPCSYSSSSETSSAPAFPSSLSLAWSCTNGLARLFFAMPLRGRCVYLSTSIKSGVFKRLVGRRSDRLCFDF